MDFTLNESKKMLQSMVRDFTRKEIEPRWQEMEKSRASLTTCSNNWPLLASSA